MIRTPKKPLLTACDTIAVDWHTLHCELVTPMYGGGVDSTVVDSKMPIRATGIRGQLRFWWRLLAKHKMGFFGEGQAIPSLDVIKEAEFALWGGMDYGDKGGKAGQVLLRVTDVPSQTSIKNNLVSYDQLKLPYVLFPASNETDNNLKPHKLLQPNKVKFKLLFAFSPSLHADAVRMQQVIETLQWWANFGGLGFRSRKGLGSVRVNHADNYPQIYTPLSAADAALAGCQLVQRQVMTDAMQALRAAINKLKDFRQGVGVGRNKGRQHNRPGRSRWPEPDALRRILNKHHSNHKPEHQAGKVFPRAIFGLPIVYHFDGDGEPDDTNLEPAGGERLASPLILRAVYAGEQNGKQLWQPSALLLPYQHILNMQVTVAGQHYPIWQSSVAEHINPIQENTPADNQADSDPLQAFLTYFPK